VMDFLISKTNKGGKKLVLQNYSFYLDKSTPITNYWKCVNFRTCKARLKTNSSNSVNTCNVPEHNHDGIDEMSMKINIDFQDLYQTNRYICSSRYIICSKI